MDWLPDWSGTAVTIVASGPSAKDAGLDQVKGKTATLAIKASVQLCPWADMVYGCDAAWWIANQGLPGYRGVRVAWEKTVPVHHPGIHLVQIEPHNNALGLVRGGRIGSGGNSGFQALNIAVQAGATKIVLVGFDMHDRSGAHWYGRNNWIGANNPDWTNFGRWRAAFHAAAPVLKRVGVEVVNASPRSDLGCFPKHTIGEVLKAWRL